MNRRTALTSGSAIALSALAWSGAAAAADPRMADVVRAGKVRVGLFPSFMYARQPTTGALTGVAIELARALAARLGVAAELVEFPAPPQVIEGFKAGACDVAFLGIDPTRARDVDYSPGLMRADFTFIVPAASTVTRIEDADRSGVRVAVVRNHAMEFALRGKLKVAETIYADTPDAAIELLRAGRVELSAGIRPGLIDYARLLPGSRVLADRYGSNTIAIAVLKGLPDRLAFVTEFADDARSSGLAARALANAGLGGVEVPPA